MPETEPIEERAAEKRYASRRKVRKRQILLALLFVLLLAGAVYGFHLYRESRLYEDTDDAFIEGHVIPISPRVAGQVQLVFIDDNQDVKAGELLVALDPKDFQNRLDQTRAMLAAAYSQVAQAKISVELTSVTSTAGVSQATYGVTQGQSTVSAAQSQVAAAQSQVRQAEANLGAAQASLAQQQATVAEKRATAERANNDRRRYEQLFKESVVSQQQLDFYQTQAIEANATLLAEQKKADAVQAQVAQFQAALQAARDAQKTAQAQVNEAQAAQGQASGKLQEVNVTPQKIASSQSALEAAQAEVKRLEAAVRQAELDTSYTQIVAPEDGRVTRKAVEPGMYVQVGQPLFSLVPLNMWVIANFKETQLNHMRPGQKVTIRVDAYPKREFHGHVDSIQRGTGARFSLFPPENATGNYIKVVQRVPVKIVFDEPPENIHLLGPGMSVVPKVRVQ